MTKSKQPKSPTRWYVYILFDSRKRGEFKYKDLAPFDHEPIYVGYGVGRRMTVHVPGVLDGIETNAIKRNKILSIIRDGGYVIHEKYRQELTKEDARLLEMELIDKIGRIISRDGPLTNVTKGGDRGWISVHEVPENKRRNIEIVKNRWKDLEYREKMRLTAVKTLEKNKENPEFIRKSKEAAKKWIRILQKKMDEDPALRAKSTAAMIRLNQSDEKREKKRQMMLDPVMAANAKKAQRKRWDADTARFLEAIEPFKDEMISMRKSGASFGLIANFLNEKGVKARKGKKIYHHMVSRLFKQWAEECN